MGPDGNIYNYYYGNINIFIQGDFGFISYYILNRNIAIGRNKFVYNIKMRLFDDAKENLKAFLSFQDEYPGISFEAFLAKPNGSVSRYR